MNEMSSECNKLEFIQLIKSKRKVITNTLKHCINGRKLLLSLGLFIGIVGMIYLTGSIVFTHYFYWGTTINGLEVGGKSVSYVERELESQSNNYSLELKERLGQREVIKGAEIGLTYSMEEGIIKLKESQKGWLWPWHLRNKKDVTIQKEIGFDKQLLKDKVNTLKCLMNQHSISPVNAEIRYINGAYEIVEGDKGNQIDALILYKEVQKAVSHNKSSLDLEEVRCYKEAEYTSKSPKLNTLKNQLNKYLKAEITYYFGDKKEKIDKNLISSWLSIDEAFQISLNEDAIADYIVALADTYDTLGVNRTFRTSTGQDVEVAGGDYGWKINEQDEIGVVIDLLQQGIPTTRTPLYIQEAFKYGSNDIGNTYVEINLSKQYLWFYKEGILITEGSIVTGNLSKNYDTPQGTYTLDYKKADTILRGPGYASPVKYWMPFNGGIGLHDASWRRSFGGEIYETNGSHGCVNLPTQVAEAIFNNIESGIPIVCYFE